MTSGMGRVMHACICISVMGLEPVVTKYQIVHYTSNFKTAIRTLGSLRLEAIDLELLPDCFYVSMKAKNESERFVEPRDQVSTNIWRI